jgi:hypothetical protein
MKKFLLPSFVALFCLITCIFVFKNSAEKEVVALKETPKAAPVIPPVLPGNNMPSLLVKLSDTDSASSPLIVKRMDYNVKVIGNIATTTLDITFYNDLDRVLDGEFCFPLGEDQSVSYFGMYTDQGLREASVVEKQKARVTYEAVIRRKVDPALLELTAGNNFRSRIYPIPAKGTKRIVIGFEQKLIEAETGYLYHQPFNFKDKIEELIVRTEVFKQESQPELYGKEKITLEFDKWQENWKAEKKLTNYLANKPLSFLLPKNDEQQVFIEDKNDDSYFFFTVRPEIVTGKKKMPSKVTLLWDRSGSAEKNDKSTTIACIEAYLQKAGYPMVELVSFSNDIIDHENFEAGAAGFNALSDKMVSMIPDGATQLGCLDLTTYDTDEFILVSDGISNFGKHKIITADKPLYTISASPSANYSYLENLSAITGGSFINLTTTNFDKAVNMLSSVKYRFIKAEFDDKELGEVYPSQAVDVNGSFSMTGQLKNISSEIIMHFGVGNTVLDTKRVVVKHKPGEYNGMVNKMWAQTKLSELDIDDRNKEEVVELAKEHGIVTRYTSLLILDNVEDYLTYKVVPRDPVMKKEYLARLERTKTDFLTQRKEHIEEVVLQFGELKEWYKTDYTYAKPITEFKANSSSIIMADTARLASVNANAINSGSSMSFNLSNASGAASYNWSPTDGAVNAVTNGAYAVAVTATGEEDNAVVADIQLNNWKPKAPYLDELRSVSRKDGYATYLKLKHKYNSTPSFFLDVSDLFMERGEQKLALRILSNIAELQLEDARVLRVLAHRLQQIDENTLAIGVFEDVLKMRAEEPQSYRDLGLAYEQNKDYQKAADVMCKVVNRTWDGRFPEIESLVLVELNHIIFRSPKKLRLDSLDKRLIYNMTCQSRIVINWDTDNCDMDLWVTDANEEKCMYSFPLTQSGGRITNDFTGGYGPEVFMAKKAVHGEYKVDVNYYGNHNESLTGPTTVQAEIYTDYGTPKEKKKVITLRLKDDRETVNLAKVSYVNS